MKPIIFFLKKIGIIGLVEEEWITTLSTISKDDIIYEPYVEAGIRLSNDLKLNEVGKYFIEI